MVYGSGKDGKAVRQPEGARGQGHYVDGPRKSFSGGAGLVSTARDYATFLEALRNGGALGKARILSPHAVQLMTTNQIGDLKSPRGLGFGFGFETHDKYGVSGMESVGSWGWGGAYGTYYRVDPEERLTIVLMIQMIPNDTDIRDKFDASLYQALHRLTAIARRTRGRVRSARDRRATGSDASQTRRSSPPRDSRAQTAA